MNFKPQQLYQTGSLILTLLFMAVTQSAFGQSIGILADLSALPESTQNEINQRCLAIQYRDGASAYRNCVGNEIEQLKDNANRLLDNYTFDEKFAIQQSCTVHQANTQNYYQCVQREMRTLDSIPTPALGELDIDELEVVQSACADAQKNTGVAAYRECVNQATEQMIAIPRTDLSQLSITARSNIRENCAQESIATKSGSYRLCIAQALAEVLKLEREERARQYQATLTQTTDTTLNKPTLVAHNSTIEANPAIGTVIQASDVPEMALISVEQPSATDPDTPAETLVLAQANSGNQDAGTSVASTQLDDTASGSDPVAALNSPLALLRENPGKFFADFGSRDATYYYKLLFPFLVIVLALTALRFILSGRSHSQHRETVAAATYAPHNVTVSDDDGFHDDLINDPTFTTAHQQSAGTDLPHPFDDGHTGIPKESRQPRDAFDDHMGDYQLDVSATTQFYRPSEHTENPIFPSNRARTADPRVESRPEQTHTEAPDDTETTLLDRTLTTPVYAESDFGKWLREQPVEDHKRLCTEFMLYWLSFGDGEYDPALKQHLMRAVDLNEHDLIKKWVLEENPSSLVDMLQRVWSLFSKEEIEQTISLMFALLIKREITPVQNTFFRFLADFANIGNEGLDRLYRESFGAKLPPLPRPDDERWWAHQRNQSTKDQPLDDDASELSDRDICLSMLGLVEPASDDEIEVAYTKLRKRCDPAKFDLLGEKEQSLVQRHLKKYTNAYEYLIETA